MAKRYIGRAVIHIVYNDDHTYSGYISIFGIRDAWSFSDLKPAHAGLGDGIAYDSPEAYDRMAVAAVGFGAYYTTHNRGDDVPDWAPSPELADAISEATSGASLSSARKLAHLATFTNRLTVAHITDSVTREQIIALRAEAKAAGDYEQADICGQALAGDEDSIRRCERAILAARALRETS